MAEKITHSCDVCGVDVLSTQCGIHLQVIWTTEQTEGRPTKPNINVSPEKIDLCEKCYERVLAGNYIYAAGAQGYNRYFFKESA